MRRRRHRHRAQHCARLGRRRGDRDRTLAGSPPRVGRVRSRGRPVDPDHPGRVIEPLKRFSEKLPPGCTAELSSLFSDPGGSSASCCGSNTCPVALIGKLRRDSSADTANARHGRQGRVMTLSATEVKGPARSAGARCRVNVTWRASSFGSRPGASGMSTRPSSTTCARPEVGGRCDAGRTPAENYWQHVQVVRRRRRSGRSAPAEPGGRWLALNRGLGRARSLAGRVRARTTEDFAVRDAETELIRH